MSGAKLATIVAIDVAGYSARAQADEAAAIASVARLNARCAEAAATHGGRIFNTAGDAVMMEFPSVSGALEAAESVARNPDPPIRVGIHLGEVTVMANGDVLGHGVNVAARLQQMAPAGGVLVSADARRALRGPLSERLADKGVVKLNKIDESIGVYELMQEAIAPTRSPPAYWRRYALAAGVLAIAIIALTFAWPLFTQAPAPARVAVFALDAAAEDETARRLGEGMAEDVIAALTASNVQAIGGDGAGGHDARLERARRRGALLVLDGSIDSGSSGEDLRITVSVARSSDNVTLWSHVFEREDASPQGLRLRAAEQSADVLSCGVHAMRMHDSPLDTETLALFIRACEEWRGAPIAARDTLAQVVEREPRFSFARARMALSAAVGSSAAPASMRETLASEARQNAERALREDPNLGEAYIALQLTERPTNWAERERLMREAITRDERNATANNFYANLLREVGRPSEALAYAQRSVALDPLSQPKRRSVALIFLDNSRADEARDILEGMADYIPDSATLWRARLRVAVWSRRFAEVNALLDNPVGEARSNEVRACWRGAANMLRANDRSPNAIARLRACGEALPADQTLELHAALGDLDQAFADAQAILDQGEFEVASIFFAPPAAPMRADPRFMPMMREWKLLQYWRESGRWPDFCADPNLPYDCAAEAARLLEQ